MLCPSCFETDIIYSHPVENCKHFTFFGNSLNIPLNFVLNNFWTGFGQILDKLRLIFKLFFGPFDFVDNYGEIEYSFYTYFAPLFFKDLNGQA